MWTLCGPKCSLCCTIVSIWGIIQLSIMGGFFYTHSVALSEDLGLDANMTDMNAFYAAVDTAYENQAYKCWVAVAVYIVTLLLSLCQLFMNKKRSYEA
ncbi:hypothetical protein CHUAL_001167 [Chamberlinius hualienensis]